MTASRPSIVISEFMADAAVAELSRVFDVLYDPTLVDDVSALQARLGSARALIVRNRTRVGPDLLAAAPALQVVPEGTPDAMLELPTRPEAALVYRLSGDLNPLHADPAVASKSGFPKPILHGLATWGNAGRGIVQIFCDHEPTRLRSIHARFTAPVYPGETLVLECWRMGTDEIAFRAKVKERDVLVLNNGHARIAE